jgi:hypothetical protein
MAALATNLATLPTANDEPTRIITTLYDLIAAVDDAVDSPNDTLVTAAVMHLINTNQTRFVKSRHKLAVVAA